MEYFEQKKVKASLGTIHQNKFCIDSMIKYTKEQQNLQESIAKYLLDLGMKEAFVSIKTKGKISQ